MNLLSIRHLTHAFEEEPLYKEVSFGMDDGEKVAIVGPNGCGKTTLFRILIGALEPATGEIAMRQSASVAYLAQEVGFSGEETPREVVASAVERVQEVIAAHEATTDKIASMGASQDLERLLHEQDELQQQIEKLGGWDWERRVEEMLDRLGLDALLDVPTKRLSGGQQRRVDLARVLLEAPDLLLLDEPTNHLDPDTVDWLEGWVKNKTRGLLLITHDRYFLEHVVDRIVEVSRDAFYDYPGEYRVFMERKLARMAVEQKTRTREQKLIGEEIEKLKLHSVSRGSKDGQHLQELEQRQRSLRQEEDGEELMRMRLARGKEHGPLILAARGISKTLGKRALLNPTGIDVSTGDKIGLVGPNGSGKTTLLKMLMGYMRPDTGVVEIGERTDVAYLRQHGPPINPEATLYDALGPSDYVWVGDVRHHKRRFLEQFLFDSRDLKRKVRLLSGGQKRRLQLARVVAQNGNLLVLDEPTNDLDILSLQALEVALEDYDGCVIVVSHDRYFLNRVCNVIIAIEDRRLVRYEGNYDFYRRRKDRQIQREREARANERAEERRQRHERAERERESRRALSYGEKLELEGLEEAILEAEEACDVIEQSLADPTLYQREDVGEELERLHAELATAREHAEQLYERWMELEAKAREDGA